MGDGQLKLIFLLFNSSFLIILSVSTCVVIGPFCGWYFSVWPATLVCFPFLSFPFSQAYIIDILLTLFSWSVL